ncbi:uncharacterized protein LOC128552140 [Mercenaria mercenaria]|uniref:uncharacterized protein LOC128552140 n=1 Tax=Mercenaria mercenaria TaxID=6596 RepID=UPI00234EE616|nr:uncharacterized protein LOC128552140 [Mercenaria mercenaria]
MVVLIKFTHLIQNMNKFLLFGILFLTRTSESRTYDMEDYCGKELSMILESTYQLKLELSDKHIYDREWSSSCETTVEAWNTPYRKLMFYFDDLDLDCDDGHLEFFVGQRSKTRMTGLEKNICGENKKSREVFTVDARYLRIRYVPRKSQSNSDIFSMIVTSYSDDKCPSNAYECDNSRCINNDIACDEHDSCGDGSGCDDDVTDAGFIIGVVIGGLVVLAFIISVIVCCICCKRKTAKAQGTVQYQDNSVATAATNATSGQRQGYSQPVYGEPNTNRQTQYPVASTSILPTTPVASGYRATFQEPVPVLSYGQQRISPPPYSEIFAQSDHKATSGPYTSASNNKHE